MISCSALPEAGTTQQEPEAAAPVEDQPPEPQTITEVLAEAHICAEPAAAAAAQPSLPQAAPGSSADAPAWPASAAVSDVAQEVAPGAWESEIDNISASKEVIKALLEPTGGWQGWCRRVVREVDWPAQSGSRLIT